jgi:hypothetical protein
MRQDIKIMTYMKLLEALNRMNIDELMSDVTVYSRGDEAYYPVESMLTVIEEHNNDVLDNGHKYLVIDG